RRGRAAAAESPPSPALPVPPAVVAGAVALPAATEAQVERSVRAALDAVRVPLTRLVRSVAEPLTTQPSTVGLAGLEVEGRDAVHALGRELLTELVRLRGTGSRGHSYVCPCGARLVLKEVAPLQQRTWFGTVTLERAVYAGAGCAVRAHRVPLDAEWEVLGLTPPVDGLPDPDGGALPPAPPGPGPARLAPAFAAVGAAFGAHLPYALAAGLLARARGP